MYKRVIFIFIFLISSIFQLFSDIDIYVREDCTGTGTGWSDSDAFPEIPSDITGYTEPVTIWVAGGSYYQTCTINADDVTIKRANDDECNGQPDWISGASGYEGDVTFYPADTEAPVFTVYAYDNFQIIGQAGNQILIENENDDNNVHLIDLSPGNTNSSDNVIIQYVRFIHGNKNSQACINNSPSAVSSNNLVIEHCSFADTYYGILLENNFNQNVQINDNTFISGSIAIKGTGSNISIYNNQINNLTTAINLIDIQSVNIYSNTLSDNTIAIDLSTDTLNTQNVNITGNTISSNSNKAINLTNTQQVDICYNTISDSSTTAIAYDTASDDIDMFGNVLYQTSTGGTGISCGDAGSNTINIFNNTLVRFVTGINAGSSGSSDSNTQIKNNLLYNNTTHMANYSLTTHNYNWFSGDDTVEDDYYGEHPVANSKNGQVSSDDPFDINYHLSAGTDEGNNLLGSPYDIDADGNLRGHDLNWDRGAYEYDRVTGIVIQYPGTDDEVIEIYTTTNTGYEVALEAEAYEDGTKIGLVTVDWSISGDWDNGDFSGNTDDVSQITFAPDNKGTGQITATYNGITDTKVDTIDDIYVIAPFDLVLVLDKSGSMGGRAYSGSTERKIEVLREAIDYFINITPNIENEVGLVRFNKNVVPFDAFLQADLALLDQDRKNLLRNQTIPSITAGGRTSIGDGLLKALIDLPNVDPEIENIFLITDGCENEPVTINYFINELNKPEYTGVKPKIYALGIGYAYGLNETKLTTLASSTNGEYRRVENTGDMDVKVLKIFHDVLNRAAGLGTLIDPIKDIGREDTHEIKVNVTSDLKSMMFSIFWQKYNKALDISIRTPGGKTIDKQTINDRIRYGEHNHYAFFHLDFPLSGELYDEREGEWEMIISGNSNIPSSKKILFASTISAIGGTITVFEADIEKLFNLTGEPIKVTAQLNSDNLPLTGTEVDVYCDIPTEGIGNILHDSDITLQDLMAETDVQEDTDLVDLKIEMIENEAGESLIDRITVIFKLFDDGEHDDGAAGDGIYSNTFVETRIPGTYDFRFVASNIPIEGGLTTTREWTKSFYNEVNIDPDSSETSAIIEDIDPGIPEPVINCTPDSLVFQGNVGAENPAEQSLTIKNDGAADLVWNTSVTYNATNPHTGLNWLSVDAVSGTIVPGESTDIAVAVDLNYLSTSGNYKATITFTHANKVTVTDSVDIVLNLAEPLPVIKCIQDNLLYESNVGDTGPIDQSFTLSNDSLANLSWEIAVTYSADNPITDVNWLSTEVSNGNLPAGATMDIPVSINLTGLNVEGQYQAVITVSDTVTGVTPDTVIVTLNLGAALPVINCLTDNLHFSGNIALENPDIQSFVISNDSLADLSWNASISYDSANPQTGIDWLNVTESNGETTAGSSSELHAAVNLSGLNTEGLYSATITITGQAPEVIPDSINVTLDLGSKEPVIICTPFMIEFRGTVGGANPPYKLFTISNKGSAKLSCGARIIYNPMNPQTSNEWLGIGSFRDIDAGASIEVPVAVNLTEINVGGQYQATIEIMDTTSGTSVLPDTVSVILHIDNNKNLGIQYLVRIAPRDVFGNYLGPGHEVTAKVVRAQGEPGTGGNPKNPTVSGILIKLDDNIDGTYTKLLYFPDAVLETKPVIKIYVDGEEFSEITPSMYYQGVLSLHAGTNIPLDTLVNDYEPGFSAYLDFGYYFTHQNYTPALGLLGIVNYNWFRSKTSGVDDLHLLNISANIKYRHQFINQMPAVYVMGGVGYYINLLDIGSSDIGVNAGAGIYYDIMSNLTIDIGTNYHYLTGVLTGQQQMFMQVNLGIIWRFQLM